MNIVSGEKLHGFEIICPARGCDRPLCTGLKSVLANKFDTDICP